LKAQLAKQTAGSDLAAQISEKIEAKNKTLQELAVKITTGKRDMAPFETALDAQKTARDAAKVIADAGDAAWEASLQAEREQQRDDITGRFDEGQKKLDSLQA